MTIDSIPLAGIRWEFLSEERRAWMDGMPGRRFEGTLVKGNAKRRVVRRSGIYAKEVVYQGPAVLFKSLAGGTACKEGRISQKLARLGIRVPRVLGYGAWFSSGLIRKDVLLTEEVRGGRSLHDFVHNELARLSFAEKRQIICSFAEFVRKLHMKGVFHADLHIGNILIAEEEGGVSFVLLDTDRVSVREGGLKQREKVDSLALLLSNLWSHTSRSQRFRFLREYGMRLDGTGRRFVAAVGKRTMEHSRHVWRKKTGRCLYSNNHFTQERRDGLTVYQHASLPNGVLDRLLSNPDQVLEEGEVFKAGRTVRAAKVIIGGREYFLKRYNCKGWLYRLRNAFRRSRAVRTWYNSWGFFYRGLPVPLPLACLEERSYRLLGRSYILFEFLQGTEPLAGAWARFDVEGKRALLRRLGILIGRMHNFGCLHGDLKWSNILVRNAGRPEVFLADLDGSRIPFHLPMPQARKDIDRFMRDLESRESEASFCALFARCWRKWGKG